MCHTDIRTLLDLGRKAGLRTAELYQALNARQPQPGDFQNGIADTNGFVPHLNAHGQQIHESKEMPVK